MKMKMKKLIVVLAVALLAGVQAHAQFIADAGYIHAFETAKVTSNGSTVKGSDALDGFYAGGKVRLPLYGIAEGLSIDPGVNFSFLFGKDAGLTDIIDNASQTEVAVNLPVHVNYVFEVADGLCLQAYAGPTFQYGIIFNAINGTTNPTSIYNYYKDVPGDFIPARNHVNLFVGAGVGIEVAEMVNVLVGFDFGVLNQSTGANRSIYRNQLKVGVGYIF